MGYRIMGRVHAAALGARARAHASPLVTRMRGASGQGTVEYVALILLVAGVFATVIVAAGGVKGGDIAKAVSDKIKSTIEGVGAKKG